MTFVPHSDDATRDVLMDGYVFTVGTKISICAVLRIQKDGEELDARQVPLEIRRKLTAFVEGKEYVPLPPKEEAADFLSSVSLSQQSDRKVLCMCGSRSADV